MPFVAPSKGFPGGFQCWALECCQLFIQSSLPSSALAREVKQALQEAIQVP